MGVDRGAGDPADRDRLPDGLLPRSWVDAWAYIAQKAYCLRR